MNEKEIEIQAILDDALAAGAQQIVRMIKFYQRSGNAEKVAELTSLLCRVKYGLVPKAE